MNKIIVCLALAALAWLPAAQAGEGKTTEKSKAARVEKTQLTSAAKSACAEKSACDTQVSGGQTSCAEKSSCCEKGRVARKVANPDQKGAMFLVKR
jgi:hypothetical protein